MRGERWQLAKSRTSFDAGMVRVRCERAAPQPELERIMALACAAPELLDALDALVAAACDVLAKATPHNAEAFVSAIGDAQAARSRAERGR